MKGIIYALLATVSYSSTPTFTQVGYKAGIQTNTLLFSRHLISLICLLPMVLRKEVFSTVDKKQIPGLVIVALSSIIGNLAFNHAYHYLPNMIAVSVSLTYIVFVFIIEIIMGREIYNRKRGLIIVLAALGMLIIALPGFSGSFDMVAFGIGILAAIQYSAQVVFINSKNMKQVPANVIVLTTVIPIMIFSSTRSRAFRPKLMFMTLAPFRTANFTAFTTSNVYRYSPSGLVPTVMTSTRSLLWPAATPLPPIPLLYVAPMMPLTCVPCSPLSSFVSISLPEIVCT